jgi:hypothetical protein
MDAQVRTFTTLVEVRGWTVYKEYIEEGKSSLQERTSVRI